MKLCEKSVFEDEAYYDYAIRFGDDSHMMYPAFLNSRRVVIMEGALYYHYRYVEDSIVHGYDGAIYEYQNSFLDYLQLENMGIFTAYDKQNKSEEKLAELKAFEKSLV